MSNHINSDVIRMSDIKEQDVKWLWYPYIPAGKITMLQGDPGDGKTMLILTLSALLSNGLPLPEQETGTEPITIIYQTAEDGLEDTIKPRLVAAGADCKRIVLINDSEIPLTIADKRIGDTILSEKAKLLILDPLQAFLGENTDMHRANAVRPLFSKLAQMANKTGCAVVIVGHMNKMQGSKAIYRGLGSMDFNAIARSILVVGRSKDNQSRRIMAHLKSSLAPFGKSQCFEINGGIRFTGTCDITAEQLLNGGGYGENFTPKKKDFAVEKLQDLLSEGEVPSTEIYEYFADMGISKRTVENARKQLGVVSSKQGGKFYCFLP